MQREIEIESETTWCDDTDVTAEMPTPTDAELLAELERMREQGEVLQARARRGPAMIRRCLLACALLAGACAGDGMGDGTGGWRVPPSDPVAEARTVGEPPASMCDLSDDGTGKARTQQFRGCWESAGVRCSVCNYSCTLPGIVCVSSCDECPNPTALGGAQAAP